MDSISPESVRTADDHSDDSALATFFGIFGKLMERFCLGGADGSSTPSVQRHASPGHGLPR